ncbi:hypothetical protein NP493_8g04034 [Ridgeia piscesae]|uniref:Uncharacterized protein n=1 Tax=Ridgeia piscesae TaxID=27915 RepID=A0AAD9PFP6_RIDPI|nr:hypothetical protein NP493_8g04034 [Ridgeia piscesae]
MIVSDYTFAVMSLLLAAFVLAVFVTKGESNPSVSGGTQPASVAHNIHGNDVKNRLSFVPNLPIGPKSWVDNEVVLPAGLLARYYIYVKPIIHGIDDIASMRLQIWRPVGQTKDVYKLVWERRVEVSTTETNGLLYDFDVSSDGFRVLPNDRIGWTNEMHFNVISCDYDIYHQTSFRNYYHSDYPRTEVRYNFNNLTVPATFSVAVKINPNATSADSSNPATAADTEVPTANTIAGRNLKGYSS